MAGPGESLEVSFGASCYKASVHSSRPSVGTFSRSVVTYVPQRAVSMGGTHLAGILKIGHLTQRICMHLGGNGALHELRAGEQDLVEVVRGRALSGSEPCSRQ